MGDYRKYLDGIYWRKNGGDIDCYMDQKQLDKWVHQNRGEYIECVEGCLLDNYVIDCKRGIAFVFEEYLNSWSSTYHVYWVKRGEYLTMSELSLWDKIGYLYDEWEALQNA